jgi:hypothetical protein
MQKFLINLSIYFSLTCFGFSFSPSSETGVQLWPWFKSFGYSVSVRALTLFFRNLAARWSSVSDPGHFTPMNGYPVAFCWEAEWVPQLVWVPSIRQRPLDPAGVRIPIFQLVACLIYWLRYWQLCESCIWDVNTDVCTTVSHNQF